MMIASSPGSLYATILVYYIGGDKPLSICLCLISTLLSNRNLRHIIKYI